MRHYKQGLLLFFIFLLTGCREKQYWQAGQINVAHASTINEQCVQHKELFGMLDKIKNLNSLFKLSIQHSSVEELKDLSQKIQDQMNLIMPLLTPALTDHHVAVVYQWKVHKDYIPSGAKLKTELVAIDGELLPFQDSQITDEGEWITLSVHRKASWLELCELLNYLQLSVSVRYPNDEIAFWYRFYL